MVNLIKTKDTQKISKFFMNDNIKIYGNHLLHQAILNKQHMIIELLLKQGVEINRTEKALREFVQDKKQYY